MSDDATLLAVVAGQYGVAGAEHGSTRLSCKSLALTGTNGAGARLRVFG